MSATHLTTGALSPLTARDITVTFGNHTALDGVDLIASPGHPLGLIGENGSGKSTLLRVIAGRLTPDSGSVTVPSDLGYLAQDVELPRHWSIEQVFADALAPLHSSVRDIERWGERLDEPGAAEAFDRALRFAEDHDAWDADRRAVLAAENLGLSGVDPSTEVARLSGGQQARLMLAALLTRRPACLVVDEPTNHLDDDALAYLEGMLADLPGVVVAASHDRTFLDAVSHTLLDLDPSHFGTDGRGGATFSGRFDDYLATKREARRRWEEAFLAQRDELNHWRTVASTTTTATIAHNRPPRDGDKFIYAFKGQDVQAAARRRIRDAERRVADLERHEIRKPPRPLEFGGDLTGPGAGSVRVRGLRVEQRLELDRLDVGAGEHTLITGPNGCGKSTLLSVLAGRLGWSAGDVQVAARQLAYLPQEVEFDDPSALVRDVYAAGTSPVALRDLGLVHPRDEARPIGMLSTGQRRRLGLALVVAQRPDLLLLDEPTNHLSLALATELEEALGGSPGTVIVASHDRWLRRRWAGAELGLGAPGSS